MMGFFETPCTNRDDAIYYSAIIVIICELGRL